jgi:hypothetical protein
MQKWGLTNRSVHLRESFTLAGMHWLYVSLKLVQAVTTLFCDFLRYSTFRLPAFVALDLYDRSRVLLPRPYHIVDNTEDEHESRDNDTEVHGRSGDWCGHWPKAEEEDNETEDY